MMDDEYYDAAVYRQLRQLTQYGIVNLSALNLWVRQYTEYAQYLVDWTDTGSLRNRMADFLVQRGIQILPDEQ